MRTLCTTVTVASENMAMITGQRMTMTLVGSVHALEDVHVVQDVGDQRDAPPSSPNRSDRR